MRVIVNTYIRSIDILLYLLGRQPNKGWAMRCPQSLPAPRSWPAGAQDRGAALAERVVVVRGGGGGGGAQPEEVRR